MVKKKGMRKTHSIWWKWAYDYALQLEHMIQITDDLRIKNYDFF